MLPEIRSQLGPGGLRRDPRRRSARRRGAAGRRPRRPAGGDRRARSASAPARPRTPTAPATSCCSTPARRSSAASPGCSPRCAYQFGDAKPVLRARGLDRRHRVGRPVAARPARHHLGRRRTSSRSPGPGRRQRRHLLRARVLRPVRPVLAPRRPRRHRRAVALQHQRAPGPGHARGDLLPDPRRRRRDDQGLRRRARGAQGRRRRHRQRACACSCRPTSSASPSHGRWSPRPRRSARPTLLVWPPASGPAPTSCAPTGRSPSAGHRPGATSSAATGYAGWRKAVERTLDWVDVDEE